MTGRRRRRRRKKRRGRGRGRRRARAPLSKAQDSAWRSRTSERSSPAADGASS
jgi:hypothetical protein